MRYGLGSLMVGALIAANAAPAAAARTVTLGKISCYHFDKDNNKDFLNGGRYEGGKIKCWVSLRVSPKAKSPKVTLMLTISQGKGKGAHSKSSKQPLGLAPGFRGKKTVEMPLPDFINGCMPFTVSVSLNKQRRSERAGPDCPD